MTVAALLNELRRRQIVVSVEGDRLRCVAPRGALTPEIQRQLAERKPELLVALTARAVAPPLRPIARTDDLSLSFAQERLWFLHQMEPDGAAYNIVASVKFGPTLVVAALEQALTELVRRQEILRTVFPARDGVPVARIAPPFPVSLPAVDLRTLTPLESDQVRARVAREQGSAPFDLGNGPLLRCLLLQLGVGGWELLIVQHHIITDRWSLGLLLNEIQRHYARYAGTSAGADLAPADLEIQYADFAAWQRETVGMLTDQASYWRERLSGSLPVLELATDRPRPAMQTSTGAWEGRLIPESLNAGLRALSRREGVTLFMTLLAAFKVLLSRHTGIDDVLIGSPVAGRNREELEPIIGCFINTIVLRTDLSGNPTFRDLLHRVRDTALDAFARQDMPFERIIADLRLPRDLSRSPVFQTVFVMQNAPKSVEVTADMTFSASGGTVFDLSLTAVEIPTGLQMTAEYNTDLFDPPTIARLLSQYESLLAGMVADPDARIQTVSVLAAEDLAALRRLSAGPALAYRAEATVAGLVTEQAGRTPGAVAVRDGAGTVTYAALEARSNQIARRLQGLGVGVGTVVGVCVARTAEMVAALLGVWKAGAGYVPLDPAFPAERLAYMVRDGAVGVVLSDAASAAAVPAAAGLQVVRLDEAAPWAGVSAAAVAAVAGPGDVAYVIYTSGSTGWPKGVAVPHRALVNFLTSMAAAPGLTAADGLLAVTTLSFDIAGLELLLPLTVGGRVEVATREEASDGRALAARLAASGATVLQATPATWRLLLEAGWTSRPGLRLLCGGEALPRELADRLLAGGGRLWNLYGPTETTVWSTVEEVAADGGAICIGRPIGNTQVYVLDGAGQRVPVGVLGELYIGGTGVADGYRGRPALTAEKFVPDAYGGTAGARLYRTGDVARWRPDGRLQCLGRVDHQVKVRGFRIELGEIETALAAQPTVRQAVVTAQPDLSGESRLVAYVVPREGGITASDLRSALKRSLPDYMVPSVFIDLEALPLTANLKVDRAALPSVFAATAAAERHVEPQTAAERAVAEIWQAVLGVERISADANFFDVGGHSLLAMRVLSRIEERLGVRLGPRTLMLDTLGQIAAQCERQLRGATRTGSGSASGSEPSSRRPLTPA